MSRWASVLLGSVITAAFIGPGTVTACARSGTEFGLQLLWALVFATVACFVLQSAVARLTARTELPLGVALARLFGAGPGGRLALFLVVGSVVLGCAAYQAGNFLGGTAGAELATGLPRQALMLLSIALAAILLASGRTKLVASVVAALVGVMGFAFLSAALLLGPDLGELLQGMFVARLPSGSLLLALGLVGTTVVPYNLFLGSGLAQGQRSEELRFGLFVAIFLGGLISISIVVTGTAVEGAFSFEAVSAVLAAKLGPWAGHLFGWGLCAAGFSSAITAPWAAALAIRSAFSRGQDDLRFEPGTWRWNLSWGSVLAIGATFGLSGVKPVPVILLAQAANGLILPLVATCLWISLADRQVMAGKVDGKPAQIAVGMVVLVTIVLGLKGFLGALAAATGREALQGGVAFTAALAVAIVTLLVFRWQRR